MATMISPGVYTNIIDLSEYLEEVPGTVAFMPFLSRRGPDNKLVYTTTQQDFAERYGEPKLSDYGKDFGQGPYVIWNHLAVSSNFYTLRCLPDDAQYAHLMVGMQQVETVMAKEPATAVAVLKNGVIDEIKVTSGGVGYDDNTIPEIKINGVVIPAGTEEEQGSSTEPFVDVTVTGGRVTSIKLFNYDEQFEEAPRVTVETPAEEIQRRLEMTPIYFDGRTMSYPGKGEDFSAVVDKVNEETGAIEVVRVINRGNGGYNRDMIELYVKDSTGEGAQLLPEVDLGKITWVDVINGGTGYQVGDVIDVNQTPQEIHWPTINHVKELNQFFNDAIQANAHKWINPATTGGTGPDYGFLMYFRAVGRGDYYNGLSITLTRNPNPNYFGQYELAVYEQEEDGDTTEMERFQVSFDPNATDVDGDSMFIEDVVNRFSKRIICKVSREALDTLDRYKDDFYRGYEGLPDWIYELYPSRKNDTENPKKDGYKQLLVERAQQAVLNCEDKLEEALNELSTARKRPSETAKEIIERNTAISEALSDITEARENLSVARQNLADAQECDIMDFGDIDATTDLSLPIPLKEGSEGSLTYMDQRTNNKIVDKQIATQVLADGYLGLLTKPDNEPRSDGTYPNRVYCDEMLDLDWIYFSIVYEAYPMNVKYAAMELASTYRRDCMLFTDCGDNIDYEDLTNFPGLSWSTRYAARYDGYSKIYDAINGVDIWISPIYHMANIIPMTDLTTAQWYAPAGFNRATINTIKELRWSPKQGERDALTLMQVNPIVHFPQGYTVWGQKTTQKRPSALQDVNCMRLVLYIKRALENYCKYYIFELNDSNTHEAIKNEIASFLSHIASRRGLKSYSVDVGCTEYEFKNKICHVNVSLTPMRVIEKIELNLYIY